MQLSTRSAFQRDGPVVNETLNSCANTSSITGVRPVTQPTLELHDALHGLAIVDQTGPSPSRRMRDASCRARVERMDRECATRRNAPFEQ